jgi:hypothetical protein
MCGRQDFSLKEEAQHTSRRPRVSCNQEGRLRENPVTFTSSGSKNPLPGLETASNYCSRLAADTNAPTSCPTDPAGTIPTRDTTVLHSGPSTNHASSTSHLPEPLEVSTVPGDAVVVVRSPSVSEPKDEGTQPSHMLSYSSDEEVILYTGRRGIPTKPHVPADIMSEEGEGEEEVEVQSNCNLHPPLGATSQVKTMEMSRIIWPTSSQTGRA